MPKSDAYKVESKEEFRKLGKDGELWTHYRIWATSKGGVYFHIELPASALAQAEEVLTRRAKELDAVQ